MINQAFDTSQKIRSLVPVLISAVIVWLCIDALGPINVAAIWQTLLEYSPQKWALAAVFAWVSFTAVSRYDPLVADFLNIDISNKRAEQMGWRVTAVSQLAGFGLFTGTFLRWKLMSFFGVISEKPLLVQATKLTCGVTGTFFYGLVLVLAPVTILAGLQGYIPGTYIAFVALGLVVLGVGSIWAKRLPFRAPDIRFSVKAATLTFIDTAFAASIIYLFLPETYDSFLHVYLIFLIAFGVGMISGLPGGVGPFEMSVLFLLPTANPSDLIPALMAYRAIYYVLPAFAALLSLVWINRSNSKEGSFLEDVGSLSGMLGNMPALGADLLSQNQMRLINCDVSNTAALVTSTNTVDIVFRTPIGSRLDLSQSISSLLDRARSHGKNLCIYQCDTMTANIARSAGMKAMKVSAEAVVNASLFDLSLPAYSKLRRKLRKALKDGVSVDTNHYDLSDLRSINMSWIGVHGSERGFSTGRFSKSLLTRQRVYVAFQSSRPIAFVTFSTSPKEWVLDLIRHNPNCPDGTIFTLIAHAIEDARLAGITDVSLGCVPLSPPVQSTSFLGRVSKIIFVRNKSLQGLFQFKQVFVPKWHDRHIAFSSILYAPRTIMDLIKVIHKPPEIQKIS